ncbi:hypothetical protein COHA_008437 [Chlorella ohadii]|uniref:Plasma membrane fusion protein PRM1 n=1 Tax=Chlorella ohadii TaxID=2649997 RepID=A0AAD5DNY3_9CHLO|nr:hypothetical protein COHA_008437 [Chlorella ohadii]
MWALRRSQAAALLSLALLLAAAAGSYAAEGVVEEPPYLPTCSSKSLNDFRENFANRGVKFNLSNAGQYVYDQVIPSTIPGIVLGVLCLVGFLAFLCWMLASCCCACWAPCCKCCRRPAPPAADDVAATQQFIASGGQAPAASSMYVSEDAAKPKRKWLTWRNAFWAFFIATGLAAIGVSAWGLAESITVTNYTVSDFWDLVDGAQYKVEQTIGVLNAMENKTTVLADAANTLASNPQVVDQALQQVGISNSSAVAGLLAEAPRYISEAPGALRSAARFLDENINQTITDIKDDFESPTMALQVIMFSVMIGLVPLVLLAVWKLTWPKTAVFLVALLWLVVALFMLIGTGVMRGVYVVSDDACLFAETFAISYVTRKTQNTEWGDSVVRLVEYYLNTGNATATAAAARDELVPYLPDNTKAIVQQEWGYIQEFASVAQQLATLATSETVKQQVEMLASQAGVPQVATALESAGGAVGDLDVNASLLRNITDFTSVFDLYASTKAYICCGLNDTAYSMWEAWTIVGCLGFVLAFMASGRLIWAAIQRRKAYKLSQRAAPGAAVLWTNPAPQPLDGGEKDYSAAAEGVYKAPSQLAVQPHAEGADAPLAGAADPYSGPGYGSSAAYYATERPAQV